MHGPQAQAHKGLRQGPKSKGQLASHLFYHLPRADIIFGICSIAAASGRRHLQLGNPWRTDQHWVAIRGGAYRALRPC